MVIGMNRLVSRLYRESQYLIGAIRHHLIGVHIVAGARARLKGIHYEVLMMLPAQYLVAGLHDRPRQLWLKQAQLHIHFGRCAFDQRDAPDECWQRFHARDREILQGPLSLRRVKRILRHLHLTEGILLDAKFCHGSFLPLNGIIAGIVSDEIKKDATIVAPFRFYENVKPSYNAAPYNSPTLAQLITLKKAEM